jgi:hypothetical protein
MYIILNYIAHSLIELCIQFVPLTLLEQKVYSSFGNYKFCVYTIKAVRKLVRKETLDLGSSPWCSKNTDTLNK